MSDVKTNSGVPSAFMFAKGTPSGEGGPIIIDDTVNSEGLYIINANGDVVEISNGTVGTELARGEITSSVTITATSTAGADTVVSSGCHIVIF